MIPLVCIEQHSTSQATLAQTLLFIDTIFFLDFYLVRSREVGLSILKRAGGASIFDRIP